MNQNDSISFENTEYAFEYKNNKELKKANFLFNCMGTPWLVKYGTRLTPWAIRWHIPFTKYIVRKTIFSQFIGGETLQETAKVANMLEKFNVQVILDYAVEGGDDTEDEFDKSTDEFIRVIEYAATQSNIPYMSIKVTGISRFELLEKMDALMHSFDGSLMKRYEKTLEALPTGEKEEWLRIKARMVRICEKGAALNIGVLIDAEETWIQDPVDALTIMMMDTYNKQKAIVYNTLQHYRHDRLQFLKDMHEAAVQRNFILGAKLVRGAYMERERRRAIAMNYPSPIQPDKETTDRDFNDAVKYCVDNISHIALMVASHNEYSSLYTTQLLKEANIPFNHKHVHFSQLFGMSDNITFNLAKAGFSVSKYLPFGPIKDVVPYLMRRAQENSSVKGQTGRELGLILKEMKRRGLK